MAAKNLKIEVENEHKISLETNDNARVNLPIQNSDAWKETKNNLEQWVNGIEPPSIPEELRALKVIIDACPEEERDSIFQKVFPFIASMALKVHELFTEPPVLLLQQNPQTIYLTQKQCCCLLSLAFFDALPDTPPREMNGIFTFNFWLKSEPRKLKCLLNYFKRLQGRAESNEDWGTLRISFTRKVVSSEKSLSQNSLCQSNEPLRTFRVSNSGVIEDAQGMLQADFANEFIGGGVLCMGCVQEEIRFTINPECLVSLLLCERMEDNEAIVIVGAERFCNYKGYAESFDYDGDFVDETGIDDQGRIDTQIVAFDAVPVFGATIEEVQEKRLLRDMQKLYCALKYDENVDGQYTSPLKPFATGNWGSGAFGGNPQLKSLMQWGIASLTGREVAYFPFNDPRMERLEDIVNICVQKQITVGKLFEWLFNFHKSMPEERDVFDYVYQSAC